MIRCDNCQHWSHGHYTQIGGTPLPIGHCQLLSYPAGLTTKGSMLPAGVGALCGSWFITDASFGCANGLLEDDGA